MITLRRVIIHDVLVVDFAAEDVRFLKKSGVCSFSISDRHRGAERGVSV